MAENNVNTTVVETPEMEKRFHDEYTVKMIRSGRLTTLIAALLTFLPALYLWFGLGIKPTWSQIGSGWAIILSSYFLIYFFEPLGFYPQMGLSGIYVGYLAGNIPSVRLPAMLAARAACGVEAGTKRGELIGTIAIGVSVFTNLFFVTLAAVSGVYILEVLPPFVINAFDFCLPAILGCVMAQYWSKQKVFTPLIFVICMGIEYIPMPSWFKFPSAIIISLILGYVFYQVRKKKAAEA